ncbi:hypothetical protein KI387_013484, partial [Taxus chinensis]
PNWPVRVHFSHLSLCFAGQILPVRPIRPIRVFTAQMFRTFGAKVLLFGRFGRFAYSQSECPKLLVDFLLFRLNRLSASHTSFWSDCPGATIPHSGRT